MREDFRPGMRYPSALEYHKTLSSHPTALTYRHLRQARFAEDSLGLPLVAKGSTAIIFKAEIGLIFYALRFYTRANRSSWERYEEFNTYISSRRLTGYAQPVIWFEDALRLRTQAWPVLQMEWIEGQVLDAHIEGLARNGDIDGLAALAYKWRKLVCTLQDAEFAHGDLSHGNVIVDKHGRLRLVDFDGVSDSSAPRAATADGGRPSELPASRPDGRWRLGPLDGHLPRSGDLRIANSTSKSSRSLAAVVQRRKPAIPAARLLPSIPD